MSVYSMTGYGNATRGAASDAESTPGASGSVTAELRSVNGRYLDVTLRLPDEFRALEPALRELVAARCRRGKVELRLNTARDNDQALPQPAPDQLNRLAQLESVVQGWLPRSAPLSVHEAMHWCRASATGGGLDEVALEATRSAVEALCDARAREGARLVQVLTDRTSQLRKLAAQAAPLVPAAVQRQQQRFLERWKEALATTGAAQTISAEALQERALNEAAAYAIRIDVAEELARLESHLDEIDRLLKRGGEVGKRLDFLIQELHREANTMGSKSSALELTAVSVDMKVAIEQMREQVQNLE